MKLTILGGFIIVSGAIMFSAGSIDGTGNSWMSWTISLQNLGAIVICIGVVIALLGVFKKNDKNAPS